ncbi:hypothetical protein G5B35_20425, partial [Parapusillimonas sp. SGNA-6]|nr:hypothetical protein [Parapusillimonas sp. SGNA-6]
MTNSDKLLLLHQSLFKLILNKMDKALVIVISLLLSASFLFAQHKEVTINGVVKDAQGQLIPGATVYLNGTSWSTISDNNGKYALKV